MDVWKDVTEFAKIGHPEIIASEPSFPHSDKEALVINLVKEEYHELMLSIVAQDLPEIADAIGDLIWVCAFMAAAYGIPLDEVWEEIRRTNMAKFPDGKVLRRDDGKIMKPAGWQPPDIKGILERAMGHGK